MKRESILRILDEDGVLRRGSHFVYASGDHGDTYFNKDGVLLYPTLAKHIGQDIARGIGEKNAPVVIVGPATAGIALAHYVGLGKSVFAPAYACLVVYAEKEGSGFVFRRGFDKHVRGARVIVVEDVLTTGGSVKKVIDLVREYDGEVVGVGAICNRGGVTADDLGVPNLYAFLDLDLPRYAPEACPLCADGIPINTELGHGATFVARHGQPPFNK